MRFSEFIGNEEIVNRLKEKIESNHGFHAYIFDGAEGVGKKRLAYTLAQVLMCKSPVNGEPCEVCSACKKVVGGNHGDLHYITTDGSSIKDEQIEELQGALNSKPFDGDRTILIIDKADTMTPRAQNRLLKTLEEPGAGAVIILLTERISEVLPTITSRSQVIRLKPAENEVIKRFLIEKYNCGDKSAEIAAAYSYGSPGKAVRLLEDEDFKEKRSRSISCAIGLLEKKTLVEFMELIKDEAANKEAALDIMEMMAFWYRDVLMISGNMDERLVMNRDYLDELKIFAKKTNLKQISQIIEKIETAKYDIIMNVNINYVLKNMYLEIN